MSTALGLYAGVLAAEANTSLRSRCHLWPVEEREWELIEKPGQRPRKFRMNSDGAVALLNETVAAASQAGLKWNEEKIMLQPSLELVQLIQQSQEAAARGDKLRLEGQMTTLGIHYLTGCAVATDRTRSSAPEFPPHFGRVFMAMAATYFETRGNEEERAALEWLESAGPPSIKAGNGHPRLAELEDSHAAVNDDLNAEARTTSVPRGRQSRSFPTMRLDDPFVYLKWNSVIPEHLQSALERLCSKVTRIGHSSSLVQMWVAQKNCFRHAWSGNRATDSPAGGCGSQKAARLLIWNAPSMQRRWKNTFNSMKRQNPQPEK